MPSCSDCVSYVEISSIQGECHLNPPMPTSERRGSDGFWPIVASTDVCEQFEAGEHPGTECSDCQRLDSSTRQCRGRIVATGSYKGRLSDYAVQKEGELSCTTGFLEI